MKIYIDCCQQAMPYREEGIKKVVSELLALNSCWKGARERFLDLKRHFAEQGIEVLDFGTKGFDPNRSSVTCFVSCADAVVALEGYPFLGFSTEGLAAALKFAKSRFLFVPHTVDFSTACSGNPLFVRSLFCTQSFPAKVLNRFLSPEVRATV